MTDPTQAPFYKVTVITENLASGTIETTVFDKAGLTVDHTWPEPEPIGLGQVFIKEPAPPRINMSIQPHCDEETGVWIRQHQGG